MIKKHLHIICLGLIAWPLVWAQSAPSNLGIPQGLMSQVNANNQQSSPLAAIANSTQGSGSYYTPQQNQPPTQSAPKLPKKTNNEQAFNALKKNLFPLTNEQILALRKLFNNDQEVKSITHATPPRPTSSTTIVNLEPGATPPVIRLGAGFVTSLIFLDSTGAPWPIRGYDIGDPQSFSIKWQQDSKVPKNAQNLMSNTLLIQSNVMYKQGNLAVVLQGLNTPIMITLVPGQKAIDYRVDMQVPRNGPLAHPLKQYLPSAASPDLLDVLNHIAPSGSKALTVKGEGEAWLKGATLYLRTKYNVISPSWYSTMSSSDGIVHAYALPPTSVVLALSHGKTVRLSVKGI